MMVLLVLVVVDRGVTPVILTRRNWKHSQSSMHTGVVKQNGSFTPQIGPYTQWTRVLLPDQIHFVLPLVVDLQNRLLVDGSGNHQPSTLEFLGVREKLILQFVTDVFFDEDVVGILLSQGLVMQVGNGLEGCLRRKTTAAHRPRVSPEVGVSCAL